MSGIKLIKNNHPAINRQEKLTNTKQRIQYLKLISCVVLTNIFVIILMLLFFDKDESITKLIMHPGHKLITINLVLHAYFPPNQDEYPVSIYNQNTVLIPKAYLHPRASSSDIQSIHINDDNIGSYVFEVPDNMLEKLNSNSIKQLKAMPYTNQSKMNATVKRKSYEIIF